MVEKKRRTTEAAVVEDFVDAEGASVEREWTSEWGLEGEESGGVDGGGREVEVEGE
ncbi:unnamed protein product [Dovyalis caffra]|uniref:Uncharacterized protein n=1 Tax=Dovyalis caffra TaxID=77055 RepID=A0AAV1QUT9_9ROSI|nr:unnamed protein product [Dovyalis caffra]